jgi:two-component system response regulator GlrR
MPRILVVEDDPDLVFLYNTALTNSGFEVISADSARVAMAELDYDTFDLIILDLNMPDAHGTAVIDHLRRDARHESLPIVVITANDHWLDDVLQRGVEHIMVKPVSMKQVVELIRMLTAEK